MKTETAVYRTLRERGRDEGSGDTPRCPSASLRAGSRYAWRTTPLGMTPVFRRLRALRGGSRY